MRWPRAGDELDRWLGADPVPGCLLFFEPRLPSQSACDPARWTALRVRADERRREWLGPVGDAVRALEVAGVVAADATTGLLRDASTGEPLDRAHAELLVSRSSPSGGSTAPA